MGDHYCGRFGCPYTPGPMPMRLFVREGKKTNREHLDEEVNKIRTHFELQHPVMVSLIKAPKDWLRDGTVGDCGFAKKSKRGPHWRIRISKALPLDQMMETLVHEYAHAMAWAETFWGKRHGPLWGVCYSYGYSLLLDED